MSARVPGLRTGAWPALGSRGRRARYALDLLLERRLWIYLAADAFLLFIALLEAIEAMSRNDYLDKLYGRLVVLPDLLLGVPAMAGMVALERRAGSLDLALAVPSTTRYFVRRIAPVCVAMIVQAWALLAIFADGWELARALYQSAILSLLLGAMALFWASRLRTAGGVWAACLASAALMSPFIFTSPVTTPPLGAAPELAGIPLPTLRWLWHAVVMTLASAVFFLYARQRLERPESMIE